MNRNAILKKEKLKIYENVKIYFGLYDVKFQIK